ncbi:hypothetical protein Tco_1433277, partial [Tanacetum coccineum]
MKSICPSSPSFILHNFIICLKHSNLHWGIRLKFDDERVTKEDMKRALDEQYGEEKE